MIATVEIFIAIIIIKILFLATKQWVSEQQNNMPVTAEDAEISGILQKFTMASYPRNRIIIILMLLSITKSNKCDREVCQFLEFEIISTFEILPKLVAKFCLIRWHHLWKDVLFLIPKTYVIIGYHWSIYHSHNAIQNKEASFICLKSFTNLKKINHTVKEGTVRYWYLLVFPKLLWKFF